MLHDERDREEKTTRTQQQNSALFAKVLAVVLDLLANSIGGGRGPAA
jgi:hypothetical protein